MRPSVPSHPPRVALIGVTGYAGIYLEMLRPFRLRGELALTAAVIINRQHPAAAAAAAELAGWGVTIYASAEEMFAREAGRIDLCLIPTGIAWHARMTVAALRAGMHVLVEKPLAGSLADVAIIRDAERETGRWVAVGFQDIYSDSARDLRADILAGALGTVRSVSAIGLWPRPASYYTRNHWAGRLRADDADVLDSPLNNAFAHFVNLGLYFAASAAEGDEAVRFHGTELLRANAIESFDTAVVRARTAGNVAFWFGFSHATFEQHDPEIMIVGTRGRAHWVHEKHIAIEIAGQERRVIPMPDAFAFRHRMLSSVLAKVYQPEVHVCDTALAARHTAFIRALHAQGPVNDFPSHLVERHPAPGSDEDRLVVTGLGDALRQAYRIQSSLADTGLLGQPALVAR